MTVPAVPGSEALSSWRGGVLPETEGVRRIVRLTAALGLVRRGAVPGAVVQLVVTRTADLCAEDFDAGVDWLLDFADEVVNPIPALRRAAAEHAKARRERTERARAEAPVEGAVPCPPEIRARLREIGVVRDVPRPESANGQRLRGLRQLATVLGGRRDQGDETPLTREGGAV